MGRILGHRAGRRVFVGVLALAGLALAACEPLKPAPEPPPPPELPPICVPNGIGGEPGGFTPQAAPAPEPGCTPICLPGQEPQPDPTTKAQLGTEPTDPTAPDCVPICPPSDGGGQPQLNAQARVRCIRIPIPCVPGFDIPDCVNFCPPGQDQPVPTAALEPAPERCTPLCTLIPPGSPGACEEPQLPRK